MAFDIITNSTEFDKEILLNQFFATFGENYTQQEKDLFTQAIKDAVSKYHPMKYVFDSGAIPR